MLTSWQAHGAKLEAVRAEFQTDPQNIRDVLRLWQLHGNSINSFLENDGVEENGGSGRLPSPSSRALHLTHDGRHGLAQVLDIDHAALQPARF